jgi:hypothetical protein
VIEEVAHAPSLRALHGHQAHMTADMIAMAKVRKLGFVAVCIALKAFDAFFNQVAESGADLESLARIRGSIFHRHCETPRAEALKEIVKPTPLPTPTIVAT